MRFYSYVINLFLNFPTNDVRKYIRRKFFFGWRGGGGDKEAFHNLGLSKYIMVIWIFQ